MPHKKPKPDHRLSWRNPAMPVIRAYKFGDGSAKTEIDPDYERRYREMLMQTTAQPAWKHDPTYHMSRKNKNG